MTPIERIRELAQDVYYSINGSENDDTGVDAEAFENNFIRGFNLWLDEYDDEAYWNNLRVDDYELATIANTTTFSFDLPDDYRTPVFDENKYVKLVVDGTVIKLFKLVDPSQRVVDDDIYRPDRATFVDRKIVLSRAPKPEEVGAKIVLDVVKYMPKLTRDNDDALDLLYSKQLAVLGVAKNATLADVPKVNLNPVFTQKYTNELQKAIAANNATTENDRVRRDSFSYVNGIW